jgi:hypothetical protein
MFFAALLIGIVIAAAGAYVVFQILNQRTNARVLRLERELALIRAGEADKQQRLNEIFLAIAGLQRSTEERLSDLRKNIERYFAAASVN